MKIHPRHIAEDILIIVASVIAAVVLAKTGAVQTLLAPLGSFGFVGIFIAGMFFTSAFTTAPAIAVLGELAHHNSIFLLAFLGAFGAVCGDYLIFRFVKDRVADDFHYIFSHSRNRRLAAIFGTRIIHWFLPFLAALIIAFPLLPDEVGIAILGISKSNTRTFFVFSFLGNLFGIFIIASIALLIR